MAANHRRMRPLLPATGRTQHYQMPVASDTQTLEPASKRSRVESACEACHKRKTKCSGERPKCRACIERATDCRYAAAPKETSLQTLKRERNDLVLRAEILDLMNSMSPTEREEIFRRCKLGHDVKSVLEHVKNANLMMQMRLVPPSKIRYELPYMSTMPAFLQTPENHYLTSLILEATSTRSYPANQDRSSALVGQASVFRPEIVQVLYTTPYHVATLCEPGMDYLRPSLWTGVSQDDSLMRTLLDTYLKGEYQCFPLFQKNYFLQDMRSHKEQCCSSLLVNAVLALSSFSYYRFDNRSEYWNPRSLGYQFLAEAKRLWQIETAGRKRSKLTTVQAAGIINMIDGFCGQDKVGDEYGQKGIAIANEMRLFDGNAHIKSERIRNARNFTAWGLFNLDSLLSFNLKRVPTAKKPPENVLPNLSSNRDWYGETCFKYPGSDCLVQNYFGEVFRATCAFRTIMYDMCYQDYGNKNTKQYGFRLKEWYGMLPDILKPRNIILPAHFSLHLDYQVTMMTLFQSKDAQKWDMSPSPEQIVAEANRSLQTLIRLYYIRHGLETMNSYIPSPLFKLAYQSAKTISDSLSPQELAAHRSTLFLAMKGLHDQGRSAYLAKFLCWMIKNILRQKEAVILQQVTGISDEKHDWKGEIQANWKPTVGSMTGDSEAKDLTTLAEQFKDNEEMED